MKSTNKEDMYVNGYKIVLRHAKGWREYDCARVQISIQPNPISDLRIQSIIKWSHNNFRDVTLCLHDTIQRYNYEALGFSKAEAHEHARRDGDTWIQRNLADTPCNTNIIRWDCILEDNLYQRTLNKVDGLFRTNKEFSDSILSDLDEYTKRCLQRGEKFDTKRQELSLGFLLEEVSGYVRLNQTSSAVDIHPAMRMKAMKMLYDGLGDFNLQKNLAITVKTFDIVNSPESLQLQTIHKRQPHLKHAACG